MTLGLAPGCDGDSGPGAVAQTPVTGLIQQIESRSLLEIASMTIVDGTGKVWIFEDGGRRPLEFSPSHLRDHMLSGLRVRVAYHREGDRLIIDGVTDWEPSSKE